MTAPGLHWLLLYVTLVAFVYSMVGHGGASGMLAVLSLAAFPAKQVATAALVLNLVVASLAFLAYQRATHFRWRLTWPFLLGSVPCAFLGAAIRLSDRAYFVLVGLVLVYAAISLIMPRAKSHTIEPEPPEVPVAVGTGAGIGVLSGMVGVGGGIFLSPLMVLRGWANAKQTSATSAAFIVANSLAGLIGRLHAGIVLPQGFWLMAICGAAGALAGSHLGARSLSMTGLRRMLGVVLLIAAVKLLVG